MPLTNMIAAIMNLSGFAGTFGESELPNSTPGIDPINRLAANKKST